MYSVAVAGNKLKTGQQGKRAAPLAWNFIKEGSDNQTPKNPKIGPADPNLPVKTGLRPSEKARYVPDDINP